MELYIFILYIHIHYHIYIQPIDWLSISTQDLRDCGFHFTTKSQLGDILEELYPHIDWTKLYQKHRFAQQRHLERALNTLFPVRISFSFLFILILYHKPIQLMGMNGNYLFMSLNKYNQ